MSSKDMDDHIYECDLCAEQVGPEARCCPRCGLEFDTPVPVDAAPPSCRLHPHSRGASTAARATIILSHSSIPPWLPTLRRLTKNWVVF